MSEESPVGGVTYMLLSFLSIEVRLVIFSKTSGANSEAVRITVVRLTTTWILLAD